MQMFWMDIDPADEIEGTATVCAESSYSIDELKAIFLNEVRPAVSFNMYAGPAPEWTGFDLDWLVNKIIKVNRFGKSLPMPFFHKYAYGWWQKLEIAIIEKRSNIVSA